MNPSPLKVGFFSEPPKYESFSSLIPPYFLKVTKFLGKTSHFQVLVMNIFAYKNFLSLNISDFNLFFMLKLQTPLFLKKASPPLSQQPPSKS